MGMFCLHDTRMREWNERTDAASAIGSLSEYFCFVWPHQKIKKKKKLNLTTPRVCKSVQKYINQLKIRFSETATCRKHAKHAKHAKTCRTWPPTGWFLHQWKWAATTAKMFLRCITAGHLLIQSCGVVIVQWKLVMKTCHPMKYILHVFCMFCML